ncbi:MAG: hypothetical protein IID32_04960 [Planctomycetes bacterium]|nr:hypothetical protein [Planctomycetota bacterium]
MTLEEFRASLKAKAPPGEMGDLLVALWHEAKGDWDRAHQFAQSVEDADGSWVHAYLHRKEGDSSNASYWYKRANKPFAEIGLEQEWEQLVEAFLGRTKDEG